MGKLKKRKPGARFLTSSLPGSASRTHVESQGLPLDSTKILEALPGKLDIKRHSPSVLFSIPYFVLFHTSEGIILSE